jgi:hypothetical protein
MRTTVTGTSDDVAHQVEQADQSLRTSFAGLGADVVEPEVRRSVAEMDIVLSDAEIREWAQRISDRADHRIDLT